MASSMAIAAPPVRIVKKKKAGLALWMERVLEECDRAAISLAADPVHDLRVALRRCRSVADGVMAIDPGPGWKQMKKSGRDLFRSLGALRDVHVMQEWVQRLAPPGDSSGTALAAYLQAREIQCQQEASVALARFDRKQWKKWSGVLPRRSAKLRPGSAVFHHLALERWTDAHELHGQALRNRSKIAFHNLRIGIKNFRYIVENFLPPQHAAWNADLKDLQDLLGEVHDLDVLWSTALQTNVFSGAASRSQWHARISGERSQRIEKYRNKMVGAASLWPVWRAELPRGAEIRAGAMARLKLWGAALDPDVKHASHVTKLALQLYDLLPPRPQPADYPSDPRTILQVAALLHDVGRSKRKQKSHKATFRLIDRLLPPLGFSADDLHLAAVISRYHQGALPRQAHPEMYGLTTTQRHAVMRLAAILRLAGALDAGRDGRIKDLRVEAKDGYLVIPAQGYAAMDRLAAGISAARHLLEVVYRKPVLVQRAVAPRPRAGARASRSMGFVISARGNRRLSAHQTRRPALHINKLPARSRG